MFIIPIISLLLILYCIGKYAYGDSYNRENFMIAGLLTAIIGLGLLSGLFPIESRPQFVPRANATITKTPTAVLVETQYGRSILETIEEYQVVDSTKGVWYRVHYNSYGGMIQRTAPTLIDPNPNQPPLKLTAEIAPDILQKDLPK